MSKQDDLEYEKNESLACKRLKAMIKAFEAGKLTNINGHKDGHIPERDYENMPDDTVYAHL